MDKIGFVGAYDKTDVILYIAKIISLIGKKVLVIDSTVNQKAKYVVPVINPTKSYITNFEGMDIAVGFNNLQQIQEYLGTEDKKNRLWYNFNRYRFNRINRNIWHERSK